MIEPVKSKVVYYKKIKFPEVKAPPQSFVVEESQIPKNLVKEIKKIYDYKRIEYLDNVVRTYMTPKKLIETKNRNTNLNLNSSVRESRNELRIKEAYRASSNKPYTARKDDREKVDSLQSMINNLAYF